MIEVSPLTHSSDGSREGMGGIDTGGGSPQGLRAKQGQGKSRKQDKLDFFARLLEGLVKNNPAGTGPKGSVPGEGRGAEAARRGDTGKGKAAQKNPQRKASPVAGDLQAPGKPRSGEAVQDLSQSGGESRDPGGTFAFPAVQGGPGPDEKSPQGGLQKKDRSPSPRYEKIQEPLAAASASRTAGNPPVQTQASVQEAGSQGTISQPKGNDRNIQDSRDAEKAGSPKAGFFRPSRSPGTGDPAGFSPNPPQGMEAGKEPVRKGLKRDSDAKVRDKRRDRMDLRDFPSQEGVGPSPGPGDPKSGGETKTLELTVNLHTDTQDREALQNPRETPLTRNFEDLLARELSQNLNGAIVRQAQVLLRDGGEGTIRLALRPETLGNVKIQLELAEKKITGHIIVESNEALRAFEREIHSLEQAFKDSGFGETSLDMSLASGSDGNGENPHQRDPEAGPFFSERFALSIYDAASERNGEGELGFRAAGSGGSSGHIPIDMLA